MTPVELLTKFRSLDVKVWLEGERLHYSAVTGVLTPDLRAELAAKKEQIVRLLRASAAAEVASPPSLEPVGREGALPLSFAQQRLWFLDQLEPGSPLYNISQAVQLNGTLDVAALESSLNALIRRHESLRTCFVVKNGEPAQLILPPTPIYLKLEDLSSLSEELRRSELQRLLNEEEEQPFALATGPLLRLRLFRLGEDEHVLAATMHHIISDGWSMGVLTKELGLLYDACAKHEPMPLTALSLQYVDYAVWQREWLQGEVLEQQLSYWREQLAGAPPVLALPTDRPRPPVQSHRGAHETVRIDAETTRQLRRLSRKYNTTMFITILAGFQAVLSRWSGEQDIVVGTAVAGRNRPETEGVIGFFVNTLALRTDVSGNPSFGELVKRATDVCLEAYEHQDVPFEKLVEELGVQRDLSRTPLFQVMMVLQNTADEELELAGLRLSNVEGVKETEHSKTAKFDLLLVLNERGDEVKGRLEYSLDLFDKETMERLVQQFERVLRAAGEDEECRVGALPLLSEGEKERLLIACNREGRQYESAGSLREKFEAQVELRAEAVAVKNGEEEVSYGELNRRANRLAHHLIRLGVGAEARVGILLERGVELIVSILGVLKAGGAYVPLEVTLPRERMELMLEDAGCEVLVTLKEQAAGLEVSGTRVVALDRAEAVDEIRGEREENPGVRVGGQNAAYVIYTSGSTGRPKGVVVTQGNVLRLMGATEEWFRFGSGDVWTMFHSYAFDFSVWEMWGALLYGGRLVLVPYWVSREPEAFYELLVREGVTVLNQTPSAFRQLMQAEERALAVGGGAGRRAAELALRVVIFGGEALELASLRTWYERHGEEGPELINMYGITETTVHVTYRALSRADVERGGGSVIGKRLPDLEVYLLDESMELVPVGVAGEIYVGGAGLARGYLNGAALTAERFVPHPFSALAGERLYRSGDRGRYLADGDIEYLGRLDHQVKIRGFRIETGEVEAALSGHQEVREAVVVAAEEASGEKRLIAYVVAPGRAGGEAGPGVAELRNYLKQRLPDYMVPSFLVLLEALPLTPNGKLDRKALPAPRRDGADSPQTYVPPRTSAEQILASVWQAVLEVDLVGAEDNFFERGGDSIRSVRVVALASELGLGITLQQLFQYQTLGELAREVIVKDRDGNGPGVGLSTEPFALISSQDRQKLPADVEDAYPLSMLQAGMLFHSEFDRNSALYHNYTSYYVNAPYDERALELALRRLLARHPVLRTSFDLTNYSVPLQLVHRSIEPPLQTDDLRALSEAEQDAVILQWQIDEKERYFDWRQAPLLRFHVHRRGEQSFQFSFAEHHAILDGWSVAELLTTLFRSYSLLLRGENEADEAPLSSSFRDFVAREQAALESAESEEYWRKKLSGSSTMTLPRRRSPRELIDTLQSHVMQVPLSAEVSDGLKLAARTAGVPIKSVLLAAHLRVMAVLGGQTDIVTGVVSHGRPESVDAARVLGVFLNTLPIRVQLGGGSWIDLAQATFEAEREMLPHRYYPMAQVKINEGGRNLFEAIFNFTHFHVLDVFEHSDQIDVLDATGFGETDFTLAADFSLDLRSSAVGLTLTGKGAVLSGEQMEAICGYYSQALKAIAEDPFGLYCRKSLLSEQERLLILTEWNEQTIEYPHDLSLHQLFERQVELRAEAVAVKNGEEEVSYGELNRRANRLAHHLIRLGVGAEARVGILLERGVELIVSILGVLKAGGAYVPLEVTLPRERMELMLEDAGCEVLVTLKEQAAGLEVSGTRVVALDRAEAVDEIRGEREENPGVRVGGQNAAYVIYTSGSTGRPKGVVVTQGNVLRLMGATEEWFRFGSGDVWTMFHSYAFDFSVWEMWGALLYGGRLVLVPYWVSREPEAFYELLVREGVTVLNQTPSAFRQLMQAEERALAVGGGAGRRAAELALRVVIFGGEALELASLRTWYERHGEEGPELINMYGITETTVHVTYRALSRADVERGGGSVIGKRLPDLEVYLLDESMELVPVGVAGEIYVGGAGLARGYLNGAALTAERFVPHPFSALAGERLYRSGDRGRYLADGDIEYLGRLDHQVKIRGFRIETGEVEAALSGHQEVREAVVVAAEEASGEKRLIAYVVAPGRAGGEAGPGVAELRNYLKQRLPDYMVPSFLVLLEALPLTPNGKLDRKALPAPRRDGADSPQTYVPPRTLIEEALAAIWVPVLGVERVGRFDNFFWLGGHSLAAIQIISRVREGFHVELSVRNVFESPTLAEFSERIEGTMRSSTSLAAPLLQRFPDNGELPLSYAQQRLWFLDQLMPGSNAYNLPAEMYIDARLNPSALEQSLREVVRRHAALRTTFIVVGGQPVQRINSSGSLQIPLIDLSGLGKEERDEESERLRQEAALRPFDLESGPLLRAALIRLDKEEYLFLMNMHHIVSDGWSMDVLLREMETLYESFSHGLPSPLAELEIQYADYAQWQRSWLDGEVLREEVDFWKRQLDGAPTLLELEPDHPRQALRTMRGAHCPLAFSEEVSRSLREFSRQEGASLFMTLMAGFHALLWRYTGQNDILVGTPIAGRSRVELEPMIGFFVNMIPIRTGFNDAPTFRELVKQVRESSLAAYTHQELPFDKLVEELQPMRAPGRNPIFQAILAFRNQAPLMEMAKVSLPAGVPVSADTKFDLEVHLADTPGGVMGSFVYSPELFEPTFIARMVDHFQRLFEKVMAEPDMELSELSLLDQEEYRQVTKEWNDTAVAFPDAACIHQLVEQEAEQRPDAIAVEFEQENITYHELNRRANLLAHRLREHGVGPEVYVGVMLKRSAELIVALLAVAKAGGVYVPVNSTDPPLRIRFILEDAGVTVLLTGGQFPENLAEGRTVVCVDSDEYRNGVLGETFLRNPITGVSPDNLAYLMYTSGSTGTPKGVCITHRNILGLVKSANYADLTSEEVFLQFAPISFDASTFEIWASLLNGARLEVFPPIVPSLSELADFIARTQVTTLFLTTGLFHQFVDTTVGSIGAVRQLLTGGDALSPTHLNKAVEQIDNCMFVNCYGPTEATVMACCYQVGPDRHGTSVPIGRPISNSQVYILSAMQPAGTGERGELFIGGAGLGRGYLNRPDLTAERFLPDPFSPRAGGRLYRTGDAARYLNNGVIQFLGRLDNQVKISGFRIEPGEIEVALSEHPEVSTALVLAREDSPGDKRLVAYVVARGETPPTNEDLRSYLRERVPEYMVPSVFVMLKVLPLTQNGKVDRAALPAPQLLLNRSGREYVAPRNGLQQQLVDIWEELFKLHPIGLTDDFFELGGHSLQMIMLVARVEERLGKRVSIAELFGDPTIEHLAKLIGHGKENLFQSLVVPMQTAGTKLAMFSPHASGGHVWCYKDLVKYLGDDQPFYGVQARNPDTGLVFHTQIEAMASDYVEAIRGVQPVGPYLLGGWSMGGVIAFEMARQLQAQGEQIAMLALIDAHVPAGAQSEFSWGVLLSVFAFDLGLTYENLSRPLEEISAMPQMAQLRQVWKEAKLAGVVPAGMTLVEFRKIFDIYKINANTMNSYKAGEYEGRITLISAAEEMEQNVFSRDTDHVEWEAKNVVKDPLKGWGQLATEGVEAHVVPGDHFSMIREPHVTILAEQLRNCIQTVLHR